MKKVITTAALAMVSTHAFAFDYKLNIEGRADFINSSVKNETSTTTTKAESNAFVSNLVRLNFLGNINENLAYRFRYRFNSAPAATTRDSSNNGLDLIYVDHKNSIFTTRFGKTNWAEAFGRESFISSTDLYLTSDAAAAYKSNIGEYRFGASATFTFLETNKLTLALSNPNTANTDTTGETKNNSLAYGAHYSSALFNKALQPTLSYTLAKQDSDAQGTNTQKADYTILAAGFRTEAVANLIVDVDWKQFKKEKKTVAAAATDGKTTSLFANAAYSINDLAPFVQYVNDKFESDAGAVNDYKKNTIVGGVQWKPFNDVNFRYHLAYANINKKWESSLATQTKQKENKIIFGIKADI